MPTIVNPTLPNILTNGTTADATQVMGNYAYIISQINTNAAENGANSSITQLTGLTTPLSLAQGGTGFNGIALGVIPVGNNSGTQFGGINPGTAGYVLTANGAAAIPTYQSIASLVTSSVITTALGYTPVQQGTGVGQTTNAVKIGFNGVADIKVTIDSTDQGYFILSTTAPISAGATVRGALNAPAGLFDNSNRVWSPGNYQPLTVNGIGYDAFSATTLSVEGNTYTLSGRPGTWLCLSSAVFNSTLQLYRRIS